MKTKDVFLKIGTNYTITASLVATDILFLLSLFFIFPSLILFMTPSQGLVDSMLYLNLSWLTMLVLFACAIAAFFFAIFIYSFFKYFALELISKSIKQRKFDFSRLGKFTISNIVIIPIFSLITYLLALILADVPKINFLGVLWLIFLAIIFSLMYILINVRHVLFFERKKYYMEDVFSELGSFEKYKPLLIFNTAMIIGYAALFFASYYCIMWLIESYHVSAYVFDTYDLILKIITNLLVYLMFFVNRSSFFYSCTQGQAPKKEKMLIKATNKATIKHQLKKSKKKQ